jgi:D-inositol-3-phosphate glycosyltransferase
MNLLFVLQYYPPYIGGLEMLFRELTRGLAARGHRVQVLTTRLKNTPARETLHGVDVIRLNVPPFADRYFFTFLGTPAATRLAASADLVHTAPYNAVPPAWLAARSARRPLLLTALEVLGKRWHTVSPPPLSWVYRFFEWGVSRLPYDRFVAISQATLNDCLAAGMDAARGSVIYPGVDTDFTPGARSGTLRRALNIPPNDFLYLYFGRPGITKGVDVLLGATRTIQREHPRAHLALVLANEPRTQYARMKQLAAGLERVHFVKSAPRAVLVDYLREADCVVVPSITEGFGLSAAEACAVGAPVVATTAGSLPEVVSGRHLLVPPGDEAALAQAVLTVSRGGWNDSPAKIFSWENMVTAYEKIYQEVVSDK